MIKTSIILILSLLILTTNSYFLKQTAFRGEILVELEENKGLIIPFSYDIIKNIEYYFRYDIIYLNRQVEESDKSNVYFHLRLNKDNQIINIKNVIELDIFTIYLNKNYLYSIHKLLSVEDQIIIESIMTKIGLVQVK